MGNGTQNCRVGRSWHAAHFCNLNLTFISYSFWNIRRKVSKFYKLDEKRAITPRWVIRFTSKLQGRQTLLCWSFLILLTVFELLPKTCNFTISSIFSNSGHVGWCTASPDTFMKLDTVVMIQTKFGFHWSSTFRGEDFWKSFTTYDGRQVMAIAHLTLIN